MIGKMLDDFLGTNQQEHHEKAYGEGVRDAQQGDWLDNLTHGLAEIVIPSNSGSTQSQSYEAGYHSGETYDSNEQPAQTSTSTDLDYDSYARSPYGSAPSSDSGDSSDAGVSYGSYSAGDFPSSPSSSFYGSEVRGSGIAAKHRSDHRIHHKSDHRGSAVLRHHKSDHRK